MMKVTDCVIMRPLLYHTSLPLSEVFRFLKGSGQRAFCSGTDVVELYRLLNEGWSHTDCQLPVLS